MPATTTTGAYSLCTALAGAAANPSTALRVLLGTPTGALPFSVLDTGVPISIRGNRLPNAPRFKFSVGAQYTFGIGRTGWTVVPRADLNFTGNADGTVFNLNVDRLQAYEVVNAQVQLNAPGERFYARGFVQNLTANDATTGIYVSDQSSGLFTNIFTIEPRRYGLAVGFKF